MAEETPKTDGFVEAAGNAVLRIQQFLQDTGQMDNPAYENFHRMPFLVGMLCAKYLSLAKMEGAPASKVEEARQDARRALQEISYIPPSSFHLGAVNSDGLDSDVAELCKPIGGSH